MAARSPFPRLSAVVLFVAVAFATTVEVGSAQPCPPVTWRWGGVTRTTDAASFDSTAGPRRLAFDRRTPLAILHLGTRSGFVTHPDSFVVTGGIPGQEVELIALFQVQGTTGISCAPLHGCARGSGALDWSSPDSSGGFGPWDGINGPFYVLVRARVDEPFPFTWTLSTSVSTNGSGIGSANFSATMEWANVPSGMIVESCAGYFDDTPVAALPSIVSAAVEDGVVRLEWSALTEEATALAVERRTPDGVWSEIGTPDATRDRIAFEDRAVVPGERYAYRLGWSDAAGAAHRTEETWVEVPGAVTAFGAKIRNGVAAGAPFDLALSLPNREEVRLALYDLRGRRLDARAWSPDRTGSQDMSFAPDRALPPGVYWIRVVQGTERATLRAIVLGR